MTVGVQGIKEKISLMIELLVVKEVKVQQTGSPENQILSLSFSVQHQVA